MSRRVPPLLAVWAAFLMAVLLFAGCGESSDPKENLSLAAQRAREDGSFHAQMNVSLIPEEGELGLGMNVQGDAWVDMAREILEARFTVMGMELSLRYVDGTAYLEWGGKWYYLTADVLEGVGEGTIEALVKVLASFPDIFSSAASVTETGEAQVGDHECTCLEVVPDLKATASMESVQSLAAELDMTADEIEDYLEESEIEMKVYVEKDEPVIRQVYFSANIEIPEMGEIAGIPLLPSRGQLEVQIAFPEYGMKVEVQPPPDAAPLEGIL